MLPGRRLPWTLALSPQFAPVMKPRHVCPYSSVRWPGADLALRGPDQPGLPRPVPSHEPVRLLHPPARGLQHRPGLPGAFRRGGTPGGAVPLRRVEGQSRERGARAMYSPPCSRRRFVREPSLSVWLTRPVSAGLSLPGHKPVRHFNGRSFLMDASAAVARFQHLGKSSDPSVDRCLPLPSTREASRSVWCSRLTPAAGTKDGRSSTTVPGLEPPLTLNGFGCYLIPLI